MNTKEQCPICGEGHVTNHVQQIEHEYKGQKAVLASHYQECDTCLSEFAGAREGKITKRGVMAFRKSVDGLLTGDEIRALRDKYKLTQGQAAKLFGGGPVAFSKYENDDVAHSEAMDTLLRLIRRCEAAFWELVDEKGMDAELAPAVTAGKVVESITTVTNVIVMADFRNGGIRTSEKASFTYPTETKKWKS